MLKMYETELKLAAGSPLLYLIHSRKSGKFVTKERYMNTAAIRQQLHQYIDITDEKRIEALYTLLQNDMEQLYSIPAGELQILHERAEKYLKGSPTVSVEESHSKIRQGRKNS